MSEEIFDVVDDTDNVIDQQPRSFVHANNLLHRSIHILVFNDAGGVFLQKRSLSKDENPGVWDASVSGHLDQGESYEDCAVREAQEEIGLWITQDELGFCFKLGASAETAYEFSCVYKVYSQGPFKLDPVEVDHGDWFEPAYIGSWITDRPDELSPQLRLIWDKLVVLRAI
ncbi:MAG: NUDIX domain-containing protein [Gammaproteobacteria bacterium]|nr:NUDIX domain-containing protein [Gammaproteobacteria bacterium]